MKKLLLSTVVATSLLASDTELQVLKAQMEQMSKMMRDMQEKITLLEKEKVTPVSVTAPQSSSVVMSAQESSGVIPKAALLLNPSLIMDMSYVNRNISDETLSGMGLPGITQGIYGNDPYNKQEGFNLNYAELGFKGTVDPMFDAEAIFHLSEGGLEIEEAFFTTRQLPYNLRLKGGKFLSDFGRINVQHQHAWNFSTMPLVNNAFLGGEGLNEIGVQLQWIAPTDTYLMFGVEVLQGINTGMFGHEAIANPYDGSSLIGSASQPSLYVGYVKTSVDIGDTTLLAGASIASGNSRMDHFAYEVPYAFSGKSDLYGIDLTLKHAFDSYSSLTWQSEWLYRDMKGTQFSDLDGDLTTNDMISPNMEKKQAGYYTELVYAPNQTWRTGIRYENIYQNDVIVDNINQNMPDNMDQVTAMVEYHSSEFARLRLEYLHSNALFNEALERQDLDSIMFSINLALGKHGAHSF